MNRWGYFKLYLLTVPIFFIIDLLSLGYVVIFRLLLVRVASLPYETKLGMQAAAKRHNIGFTATTQETDPRDFDDTRIT